MNSFVGIDVSKHTFDVHNLAEGSDRQFENNAEGIRVFVEEMTATQPSLIVLEATGGYESELALSLYHAGLPVSVVNPKRVRDFARSYGQTAKTDKIDAYIIALFGSRMDPLKTEFPDEIGRAIHDLAVRKRQLTGMRVAEKNRMEHAANEAVANSIQMSVDFIGTRISEIDNEICGLIGQSVDLSRKAELITSFPGIGTATAAQLISGLPELGAISGKKISALIGVAPINRDSGQFRGRRMTGGGRKEIRTLLYMPTLSAIRHNPVIRDFYNRLVEAGTSKMVAIVAAMRKLIVTVNSMVAKNTPSNPETA